MKMLEPGAGARAPRILEELQRYLPRQPDHRIYLLLDAARHPDIHPLVLASMVPQACLYEGPVPRPVQRVAPYLVELQEGAEIVTRALERGWGQSWGIYLESAEELQPLRRHLRRFLEIQDQRGKTLLFRYYDPRILRVYLPTCNRQERETFFGPIWRFVMEEEDPDTLLDLRNDFGELVSRRVSLRPTPDRPERPRPTWRPEEYAPRTAPVEVAPTQETPPDPHSQATMIVPALDD